jgi:hypothetical protein
MMKVKDHFMRQIIVSYTYILYACIHLEYCVRKPWSVAELKRKQTTAVVLLGVIGAEFGQDVSDGSTRRRASEDQRRKSSVVEGFGIGNNTLARLTSMSLCVFIYITIRICEN